MSSITLKDVAERAEVSTATVSRVINGNCYVSPELKEVVERAIVELGYIQNGVARSLITRTTHTIAYVTADIANPYFITAAKAIEDIIQDYNLLTVSTKGESRRESECFKMLMERKVDALILNTSGYNEKEVVEISKQIPVILLHRRYSDSEFRGDYMGSDNTQGIRLLTEHLLSFGHEKIFVLKGNHRASTHLERFESFASTMGDAGITVDDSYPFQFGDDFTIQCGYDSVSHICGMEDKPTAVLAFNNSLALGALMGMQAHNIRVPEGLSIACFNDLSHRELMAVRPTVYFIDPTEVGEMVGKALLERLEEPDLPFRTFEPKGRLITGNAVSPPCG